MTVDGKERMYILDVPAGYVADNEYPFIWVWHPLGGSASQVVNGGYDGLKSKANDTVIFVAPDGLSGGSGSISGQGWWNEGGNDMMFFEQMLEYFNANLCIDQEKIFSTGFSFGGMMSYAMGCAYADVFRAIAPCSGNLNPSLGGSCDANSGPIAMIGIHGATDDFVTIASGRDARDAIVAKNHCPGQTQPGSQSECVEYTGCDVPTVWCEFAGGHQPWSGSPQLIWDFFSQYM